MESLLETLSPICKLHGNSLKSTYTQVHWLCEELEGDCIYKRALECCLVVAHKQVFGGCKEQLENMGTWQGCIDGKGKDLCRGSCRVEMEEYQENLVITG